MNYKQCMKTIHCKSEEIYRNKKTNVRYASKEDAQHDVNNPNTDTKQEDIVNDVNAGIGDIFMSSDGTPFGTPLPGSGAGLDANGDPEPIRLTSFVSNFSQEVSEKIDKEVNLKNFIV